MTPVAYRGAYVTFCIKCVNKCSRVLESNQPPWRWAYFPLDAVHYRGRTLCVQKRDCIILSSRMQIRFDIQWTMYIIYIYIFVNMIVRISIYTHVHTYIIYIHMYIRVFVCAVYERRMPTCRGFQGGREGWKEGRGLRLQWTRGFGSHARSCGVLLGSHGHHRSHQIEQQFLKSSQDLFHVLVCANPQHIKVNTYLTHISSPADSP